ncbi:type II secretion system protein [Sporosarcina obsidiansis]|uniref:type II secretion system protein n=1 Tax=Sporosarcina obsidiansis TaxID=2660748 RepID=UPI0018913D75|nr:type II secretion system protein [Sporosarcina obsidiansis]
MQERVVNRLRKDEKGFTFLELLLVLSIVVILSAVILPFSEKRLYQLSEEDALKSFIVAVHETQLFATTHQEHIRLYFLNGRNSYKSVRGDGTVIVEGQFPDGMMLGESTRLKELNFQPSGNLYPTGRMTIVTKKSGLITISFQFERGRMIISG